VIGHGADVAVRPAGCDHHGVRHGALAFEIDEDDVLGLVVVELGQDQIFQGGYATLVLEGGFGVPRRDLGRSLRRARRGVSLQRDSSF
jgi:hypothetical protein